MSSRPRLLSRLATLWTHSWPRDVGQSLGWVEAERTLAPNAVSLARDGPSRAFRRTLYQVRNHGMRAEVSGPKRRQRLATC
eukprot:scaffold3674_cov371-Prasinococcus_capsulatus_cf.AAC.6